MRFGSRSRWRRRSAARSPSRRGGDYRGHIELSEYQERSRSTAKYPRDAALAYPALGLAREVAEQIKKASRDDGGEITAERLSAIAKELGDVMWYVAQLATELGLDLDEIAGLNLEKLRSRQLRGVLAGSGDER